MRDNSWELQGLGSILRGRDCGRLGGWRPPPVARANLSGYMCSELGWETRVGERMQLKTQLVWTWVPDADPDPGSTHSRQVCVQDSVLWVEKGTSGSLNKWAGLRDGARTEMTVWPAGPSLGCPQSHAEPTLWLLRPLRWEGRKGLAVKVSGPTLPWLQPEILAGGTCWGRADRQEDRQWGLA